MKKVLDRTGVSYGKLTALHRGRDDKLGRPTWVCKCECGTVKEISSAYLGKTIKGVKACGCMIGNSGATTKHGMTSSRVYKIWQHMRNRTTNPNHRSFKDYGERGIKVCDEWVSFETFYSDMGDPPSDLHSLDRKDNNKNYCKDNCKWSTKSEQQRNKSDTFKVTYKGVEKPLITWCEELNLTHSKIKARITKLNWSVEKAFTHP